MDFFLRLGGGRLETLTVPTFQFSLAGGQRIRPDRDTTHSSRQSRAHETTETPQIASSVRFVVSVHKVLWVFSAYCDSLPIPVLVSLSSQFSTHHVSDFFFAAQSSFPPSPGPSPDVQLATLAQRVKEVLPHVPLGVIQRDLGMGKGSLTQETGAERKSGW